MDKAITYQNNQELLCPSCSGENLHHERVEVFERQEDQEKGLHVTITSQSAIIDTDMVGNPSGRRQGIAIHFRCETCSANPVLTIVQHKGTTLINFVTVGPPVPAHPDKTR